jgi:transposase InsO family protein
MAAVGARIRVPVAVACQVLGLSTQGYCKWSKEPVSQRDWDDAHTINALRGIHAGDPTLGYRFLAAIGASHHKKKGKAGPPVHDDLLAVIDEHGRIRHEFTATGPNQVWLTDITEHWDPSRRWQALSVCGQGLLLQQDRGLLHRRAHEISTGGLGNP